MRYENLIFLLILVAFVFSIILSFQFMFNYKTEKEKEIKSLILFDVEITKIKANISFVKSENVSIGIEMHSFDILSFGQIPINQPIQRVRRVLNLNNLDNREALVKIFCEGNICQFLNFSKNFFKLKPYENITIEISAENKGIEGNFEGFVFINIFKAKKFF